MNMPSGKQPEAGPLARAVSAEIRATMARQRVSAIWLANRSGLSRNYIGKRLRDEAAFTFNDVEAICAAIHEDLPGLMDSAFRRMERTD